MTTEQKFNCIFCKDVFDNKEELQVHFRKHADPTFKSKNRFGSDPQVSDEVEKEKSDMVSCDVCSLMFPTISKAITHKHKVHPDHDVKYFCPWCGKLFTMKHPYNIHIQTSHDSQEQIENKIFHCDCCDVDFFLPSAMMYHNKFFHRQDTDIPDVGISKKLRLYNQEILQIHYCAFCGEEYENKVNLYKHITDDHGDENQSPEEILRCPLCEAVFYHLDAYEIHLSFHTTEDLYSDQNELFSDLSDFSLETVPPTVEKVEHREELEAEAHSQDTEPENNVDALGIEKFLELAMGQAADEPDDSNPGKVKKKKHKKSKRRDEEKAAITLNEFLSMNQDVFGEDLDFQGVEEVPTRIVAKQLKNKKKATNPATAAELEKLKQKGIVVVKVGASKPTKNTQKKVAKKPTPKRELKTSSDVLTKLLNQSNNQIKITKKPKDLEPEENNTTVEDSNISNHDAMGSEIESKDECLEDTGNKDINETENTITESDNLSFDNKNSPPLLAKECSLIPTIANTLADITISKNTKTLPIENDNIDKESNSDSNITANLGQNLTINRIDNPTKLVENINDVETSNNSNDKQLNEYKSDHEESDSEAANKGNIPDPEVNDEHSNEPHSSSDNNVPNTKPVVNSLSTLKHLSHLTVKPVNQNKNTAQELAKENAPQTKLDEKSEAINEKELSRSLSVETTTENDIIPPTKSKIVVDKDPTLDTLKTLSKNLTIKSLSTPIKRSIDENGSDEEENIDKETPNSTSNITLKDVTGNKNITIKKIKVETNEPANKVMNTVNNTVKTVQSAKIINKVTSATDVKSSKPIENVQNSPIKYNTDILKKLPNITTKSVIPTKIIGQAQVVKQTDTSIKTVETKCNEEEIIEISDIDDSDDEADNSVKLPENTESTKSNDPLKNLSKHITVKSLNLPNIKIKQEKPEEEPYDDDHNHEFNSDDDIPPATKVSGQNIPSKSMAFKNVLQNLSKNLTVKSRNSSPCQSNKAMQEQDHNSQDFDENKNCGNDSDTDAGKIKITELEDNVQSDDNFEENFDEEHCDNNPIVESPHDSCSENEEVDEKKVDFESEINASTVQKTTQEITTNKNTICLNNLKNISKGLTIKSLNTNSANNQEKTKLTPPQENLETVKNVPKSPAMKPSKQLINESSSDNTNMNKKFKQMGKMVDHTKESLNQKVSVNKEVTVKTFQSKTVIQEITTTVTKTIKTVNQTVKQETRNSSQMSVPVLPQRVIGMRPSTAKNLQGVVIRHATPTTPVRPNNVVPQIRPAAAVVRPSKQIVPMRPGLNMTRPRMSSAKPNLPKSSPNKQVIGKPLKFSPSAIASGNAKRPNTDEATGPFSCFKKPRESLIPVSDVPVFPSGSDVSVQIKSASHTSTSNYMSTSKMVKGNSVVTATQMKSEVTSMQQQMSKLGNAVGIKVKSSQMKHRQVQERCETSATSAQGKQSQVQEKSETCSMKRTTLDAIEKLQKQGLLVKKPRVEVNENSDDDHVDDNVDYSSVDEHE